MSKRKIQAWREDRINGRTRCIVQDSTGGRITYIDDDCRYGPQISAVPNLLDVVERVAVLDEQGLTADEMRVLLRTLKCAAIGVQDEIAQHAKRR